MRRLLLLQPPVQDFYQTDVRLQPLGLAYLKAAVARALPEVQVTLHDFHHGHGRRTIPLPAELAYLRDYYPYPDRSPFSTFHAYYHFGASFDALGETVAAEAPDLVGISCLFTPYYRETLRAAEAIKARRPETRILVGGAHVSATPEPMLRHSAVDYVIRGEGEGPVVELLRALRDGSPLERVPSLGFKREGVPVLNALGEGLPLDALPVPDLSELPLARYRLGGRPLCFLLTSRSCPHRCSFCSVHTTFGPHYRRRSVEHVLEELRLRHAQGYRAIDFEDDNLTFYLDEMKELCRRLIDSFPPGELELCAMNGISYLSLDDELLELLRRAGFSQLNLSLVSSDTAVRESTKRPHTAYKLVRVVERAHALGFGLVAYQILGLPGESPESMLQTLAFLARLPVLLGASPFYLTPGSPIAAALPPQSEADLVRARLSAMAIESPEVPREALYTLFVATRILNFLKGQRFDEPELPLAELARRAEAKRDAKDGGRTALGFELLARLARDGVLYAATPDGLKPLPRFDAALFSRLWSRLERVVTQAGQVIRL
ncbi:MAG: B12-binding domain-containing radical SAM protein [Deltaproteobacteria bacterium]|nr:B12-binding domain-containing radical SAM protein [Deltaproteobacteria bacterium]